MAIQDKKPQPVNTSGGRGKQRPRKKDDPQYTAPKK